MENRVIKFRAWDGDKIIYQSEDGWFDKVKHPEYQSPQCMRFASVMRVCKIMQFTGLTDKNGVEIYEGDVVRECEETFPEDRQPDQVVEFNAGAFYPVCMQPSTTFEVIGNVFENPELLNP